MAQNTRRDALRIGAILLASAIVIAVTLARTSPFDPALPEPGLTPSKIPPPPGHEHILRQVISGIGQGNPDYTVMGKELADVVRNGEAAEQRTVTGYGPLQSVTYLG